MPNEIKAAFDTAFRDFVTDGIPSSGKSKVKKREVRTAGEIVQSEVDAAKSMAAAGIRWLSASSGVIRVRATGNVNLATSLENGDSLNGVVLATGNYVFLPSQTLPAQNGIYQVVASGAASRATFADSAAELARIGFVVQEGLVGTGERWTLPLDASGITLNTTALNFALQGIEPGYAPEVEAARGTYPSLNDRLDAGEDDALSTMFRATLWMAEGDGDPVTSPVLVSTDNKVLLSVGGAGVDNLSQTETALFRANLWQALGDGDPLNIPIDVTIDGFVNQSVMASTGAYSVASTSAPDGHGVAYVEAGELRAIDADGDRVINTDAGRTWLPGAMLFPGAARAAYVDGDDNRWLARVSLETGNLYTDGKVIDAGIGEGQSNEEGRAGLDAVALKTDYDYPDRLLMPATPDNNVWLGLRTSGGDSIEMDEADITGLTRLRGDAGDLVYGTTALETLMWQIARKSATECGGYVPYTVGWVAAEGGQTIANLLEDAPAGYFAFANIVTVMTKLQDIVEDTMPGYRIRLRVIPMAQGEADTTDATLGSKHDLLRSQTEEQARAIWNQPDHERVIMISWQMCSFASSSAGARSIGDYAAAHRSEGVFFCGGPAYVYPFYIDFVHHTSIGHQQRGSDCADILSVIDRTGTWVPLEMVSFAVTGANQITVQLSEAAVVDTSVAHILAITNHGITLVGGTISSISVVGSTIVIGTTGAASGVTAVRAAMNLQTDTTINNVPRTNIRSVASYGVRPDDSIFHKWLRVQEITD